MFNIKLKIKILLFIFNKINKREKVKKTENFFRKVFSDFHFWTFFLSKIEK